MLGGAVGLPASHKHFSRSISPLDLETWRETFLQAANNHKSDDSVGDSSDVEANGNVLALNEMVTGMSGGAINLSASSRPSSAPTATSATTAIAETPSNGSNLDEDMQNDSQKPSSLDDNLKALNRSRRNSIGSQANSLTPTETRTRNYSGKESPMSPAALLPPGLQQMQQLLQSQFGTPGGNGGNGSLPGLPSSLSPSQLQHLMQQHSLHQQQLAETGRKQLEQLMHQLQEQLQINLVQQTHMMQTVAASQHNNNNEEKVGGKLPPSATTAALQQLQIQQQQLISQLQLVQQRILMLPNFPPRKQHQHQEDFNEQNWKENGNRTPSPKPNPNKNENQDSNNIREKEDTKSDDKPTTHPLYSHGSCKWTGCETQCANLSAFMKHVQSEHVLDDKSTAQARVQMQIVSQLELQLQKEKERLQAMMTHLHLTKEADLKLSNMQQQQQQEKRCSEPKRSEGSTLTPAFNERPRTPIKPNKPINGPLGLPPFGHVPNLSSLPNPMGIHPTPLSALTAAARSPTSMQSLQHPPPSLGGGPIRRRISDKTPLPMSNGLPYMMDRAGLDIAQEIYRNREFYRTQDVRPPFTYASLIRQAVIEAPDRQLTLHEIYNWFTNTFAYFRRNAASWKNAIRTNLSLHKCFVRYEDDFGSFWMVDDNEFMKRRHLSRGRPRKYEPGPTPPGGGQGESPNARSTPTSRPGSTSNEPGFPLTSLPPPPPLSVPTSIPPTSRSSANSENSRSNSGHLVTNSQAKSPSFVPNPSLYGEALNASLQSALGFGEGNHLPPFLSQSMAASFHQHQQQQQREQRENAEKHFNPQALRERIRSPSDLVKHIRSSSDFISSLTNERSMTNERTMSPDMDRLEEGTENGSSVKNEDVDKIRFDKEKRSLDADLVSEDQSQPMQTEDEPSEWDYNGNNSTNIKEEGHPKDSDKDIKRERFEH